MMAFTLHDINGRFNVKILHIQQPRDSRKPNAKCNLISILLPFTKRNQKSSEEGKHLKFQPRLPTKKKILLQKAFSFLWEVSLHAKWRLKGRHNFWHNETYKTLVLFSTSTFSCFMIVIARHSQLICIRVPLLFTFAFFQNVMLLLFMRS